ncbi:hypothetical protein [Psychrobacter sp. I-STPA6b]|uniref:hypothetical protein n=1 Tax=Psychrobacter sp. I-STPA6b TaxID=2585718 RepID=UPI001D0C4CB0|nr:hypothetical protein [Psychrobacter sp. I-STPA6b]
MIGRDSKFGFIAISGALILSLGLSGCQKKEETTDTVSDENAEQVVPMSAEPAETEEPLILDNDTETADTQSVDEQTVANAGVIDTSHIDYACTPALEVNASYAPDNESVALEIDGNSMVLNNTNSGDNPIIFEANQSVLTDGEGLIQWRVSTSSIESAVLRLSQSGDAIETYDCKSAS